MPAKKTNDELNGSARFMPKSDDHSSEQSDTNLLSDEPETPSVLAEPEQIETADNGGGEKLPKSSSGTGKWVVIVLLVLALGGLGYWYYYKTKQNNAELAAKQSQIADLQAGKDKLAADLKKAQDSATASSSSDYLVVKELNVKFKPGNDLPDMYYFVTKENNIAVATKSFLKLAADTGSKNCEFGSIGLIIRGKKGETMLGEGSGTYDSAKDAIKIGDYYYVLRGPQQQCSTNQQMNDLAQNQVAALKSAFKTLQATK